MPDDHLYATILAGGSGQRFWPLSRELSPKQLLSTFGTESLIAQAVHRIIPFTGESSVVIATNERLFDELRNHLMAQPDARLHHLRYVIEPVPRNTAPAIALAAAIVEADDPDAVMVVLPSDHLLEDGELWADCVRSAAAAAADDYLVTIGIRPTRAETGYGYIRSAAPLRQYAHGAVVPHVVERFVEKPDAEHAAEFVSSGEYFWNAGIFVMKARRVLEELKDSGGAGAHIADVVRRIAALPADRRSDGEVRDLFAALDAVSIDKAVMERSRRVAVIPAALRWSDVGSLLALEDIGETDDAGNVRSGRGVDVDSRNTVVYSSDRLVATLGLDNVIVVDTTDATLVLSKDKVQDVRRVVEALKTAEAPEVVEPKVSLRPWGSWTSLMKNDGHQIKLLEVKPGARLSLQKHEHRSEHWVVVSGRALVTRGAETISVAVNESTFIPVGVVHRLENPGDEPLRVIEVQVGEYVGEDDIVRIEDDWTRSTS